MRIILITGAAIAGLALFSMIEIQKNGRLSTADLIGASTAILVVIVVALAIKRHL